jgi:hypothetical protein
MIFVLVTVLYLENARETKSSRILLENSEKMYSYILKGHNNAVK